MECKARKGNKSVEGKFFFFFSVQSNHREGEDKSDFLLLVYLFSRTENECPRRLPITRFILFEGRKEIDRYRAKNYLSYAVQCINNTSHH